MIFSKAPKVMVFIFLIFFHNSMVMVFFFLVETSKSWSCSSWFFPKLPKPSSSSWLYPQSHDLLLPRFFQSSQMSQPHFGLSVRMKLTFPKVGTWSPPGLPKTQSSIARVKTPRIELFFIPLERFWSVDVQNGLSWAIWTFTAQVMGKRKAGNRPKSDIYRRSATWRWKALKESYKIALDLIPIRGPSKKFWCPKSRESKPRQFRDSSLRVPGKSDIRM
jgi:hypothetical protein